MRDETESKITEDELIATMNYMAQRPFDCIDRRLTVEFFLAARDTKNPELIKFFLYTLLKEDTRNIKALTSLAKIALDENDIDLAKKATDRALMLDPHDAYSLTSAANIAYRQKNLSQALTYINQAYEVQPTNVRVLGLKGHIERASGISGDRPDTFLELLEQNPNDIYALTSLASLSSETGDYETALGYVSRVLDINPDEATTLSVAATIYTKMNDLDAAKTTIMKAFNVAPDDITTLKTAATIYTKAGDNGAALNFANMALKINPDDFFCLNIAAMITYRMGYMNSAIDFITHSLSVNPENTFSLNIAANIHRKVADFKSAKELIKKSLKINPKDAHALQIAANIYAQIGKPDEAQEYLRRLSNDNITRDHADYIMAKAYFFAGQGIKANALLVPYIQTENCPANILTLYVTINPAMLAHLPPDSLPDDILRILGNSDNFAERAMALNEAEEIGHFANTAILYDGIHTSPVNRHSRISATLPPSMSHG